MQVWVDAGGKKLQPELKEERIRPRMHSFRKKVLLAMAFQPKQACVVRIDEGRRRRPDLGLTASFDAAS